MRSSGRFFPACPVLGYERASGWSAWAMPLLPFSSSGSCSESVATTRRQGSRAGAGCWSDAATRIASQPAADARAYSSCTRRVLPTPASPTTQAEPAFPWPARCSATLSASSSAPRPISGARRIAANGDGAASVELLLVQHLLTGQQVAHPRPYRLRQRVEDVGVEG